MELPSVEKIIDGQVDEKLAFDHTKILVGCTERLKNKVLYTSLPIYLLPESFTLGELQKVYEIILGKRAVTPDTGLRLARVLGMPADFWLGLQQDRNLWHAMRSDKAIEIAKLEPLQASG